MYASEGNSGVDKMKGEELFQEFKKEGVEFYCGVPDSILGGFIKCLEEKGENLVVANEGGGVALAAGYYLATGKVGVVYMSNAGLGNCVNPLTSLTNEEVYGIPMILLIGYRRGEAQHKKMGEITVQLLEMMSIPHMILDTLKIRSGAISFVMELAKETERPIALLVDEKFDDYEREKVDESDMLTREEAIRIIVENIDERDVIVCTTGKASRELAEVDDRNLKFLNVGAMGHASQIALGIAMHTKRQVWCIDGDGAALMHLGGMAVIGESGCKNFKHIILNNGTHDSVGGIKTANPDVNFTEIAMFGCGYNLVDKAYEKLQLLSSMKRLKECEGPALLEVFVKGGVKEELKRPEDIRGMKEELMEKI